MLRRKLLSQWLVLFQMLLQWRHHSLHTEHFCNCARRAWLLRLHLRWRERSGGVGESGGEGHATSIPSLGPQEAEVIQGWLQLRCRVQTCRSLSSLSPKSAASYSPSCYLSQALHQAQVGVDCIWCEGGIELSAICDGNSPTRQQL